MLGNHFFKSWSNTQALVSLFLSSGQAEFYEVTKAAGIGLGFQSLLHDLGIDMALRIWTDCKGQQPEMCRGLGKLRHIDTRSLRLQQKLGDGRRAVEGARGGQPRRCLHEAPFQ